MPSRLRPTNPTAADAILVGDPGRALLAQELLVNPLMSNHARGLWGYTAATASDLPLTIQATGMGGPSAAIVLSDLVRLGLRRAVRLGTCESLDPSLASGDLVLVEAASAGDGTSRALGAGDLIEPSGSITGLLEREGLPAVTARSGDLGPAVRGAIGADPPAAIPGRVTVSDLQTAALFSLARRLEVEVAAVLIVEASAETSYPAAEARSKAEQLEEPIRRAGNLIATTLAKAKAQP